MLLLSTVVLFLFLLENDKAFRLFMKHLRKLLLLPDCLLAEKVVADERRVVRVDADADTKYKEEVFVDLLFCSDNGLTAALVRILILTFGRVCRNFGDD